MENLKRKYWLLLIAICIYSCNSVLSKLASAYPLFSGGFILFYGTSIVTLGVYAILWQQVLKHIELSVAYAAKPIATILTMIWAVLLFNEQVTWNMVLGTAIILLGIWVVTGNDGD